MKEVSVIFFDILLNLQKWALNRLNKLTKAFTTFKFHGVLLSLRIEHVKNIQLKTSKVD